MMATMTTMLSLIIMGLIGLGCAVTTPVPVINPATLDKRFAGAVASLSQRFNNSWSGAVYSNNFTVAHAVGPNDWFTGDSNLTVETRIPAGSVTKAWTAVGIMKLVDAGKIDLDAFAYESINVWLSKQDPPAPTLLEMWHGNQTINNVTIRQLIGMQAGLSDYNDSFMVNWTTHHPDKDYPPLQYIKDVAQKDFLYTPGQGGCYSSDGIVLAGLVLSTFHDTFEWDKLDQLGAAINNTDLKFPGTIFMDRGKCSTYKQVPHQYGLSTSPFLHEGRDMTGCGTAERGKQIYGYEIGKAETSSQDECCKMSLRMPIVMYVGGWSYYANTSTCILYYQGSSMAPAASNVISAVVPPMKLNASAFVDYYNFSCTNGWTMGNVAITPTDASKFFYDLFTGSLVTSKSLEEMMDFHVMTQGFLACTGKRAQNKALCMQYGLGLMKFSYLYPTTEDCSSSPDCICSPGSNGILECRALIILLGHLGEDWGSGMQIAGFLPRFGVGVSVGVTSATGMNLTIPAIENQFFYSNFQCAIFQSIAMEDPSFPTFSCESKKKDTGSSLKQLMDYSSHRSYW